MSSGGPIPYRPDDARSPEPRNWDEIFAALWAWLSKVPGGYDGYHDHDGDSWCKAAMNAYRSAIPEARRRGWSWVVSELSAAVEVERREIGNHRPIDYDPVPFQGRDDW